MKEIITIVGQEANDGAIAADRNNKDKTLKSCTLFINLFSKRINTLIDNAKEPDIVMSTYNLMKYSNNYEKNNRKVMAIL